MRHRTSPRRQMSTTKSAGEKRKSYSVCSRCRCTTRAGVVDSGTSIRSPPPVELAALLLPRPRLTQQQRRHPLRRARPRLHALPTADTSRLQAPPSRRTTSLSPRQRAHTVRMLPRALRPPSNPKTAPRLSRVSVRYILSSLPSLASSPSKKGTLSRW